MFTMKFKTDNDSFSEANGSEEVSRILKEISELIANDYRRGSGHVTDINGNLIGHWSLSVGEDDDRD